MRRSKDGGSDMKRKRRLWRKIVRRWKVTELIFECLKDKEKKKCLRNDGKWENKEQSPDINKQKPEKKKCNEGIERKIDKTWKDRESGWKHVKDKD